MGDLLEFTTRVRSEIIFYKVNAGGILFSIKGSSNAVIGLAEKSNLPCNYLWIPAINQLPDDALIGGYERETLYIIRATHRGSLTPGKFVPSEGVGYIPWGGGTHEKNDFEVLCGYNCIWKKSSLNIIPVGAVEAGYSEDYERGRLYVGRAECDGHLIPGKVQPTHNVCYVPYNGQEIAKTNYEILVVPYANTRGTSSHYMTVDETYEMNDAGESESDSEEELV